MMTHLSLQESNTNAGVSFVLRDNEYRLRKAFLSMFVSLLRPYRSFIRIPQAKSALVVPGVTAAAPETSVKDPTVMTLPSETVLRHSVVGAAQERGGNSKATNARAMSSVDAGSDDDEPDLNLFDALGFESDASADYQVADQFVLGLLGL